MVLETYKYMKFPRNNFAYQANSSEAIALVPGIG